MENEQHLDTGIHPHLYHGCRYHHHNHNVALCILHAGLLVASHLRTSLVIPLVKSPPRLTLSALRGAYQA